MHKVEGLVPYNVECTEGVLDALEGEVKLVVVDDVVLAVFDNLHLLHVLDEVLAGEYVGVVVLGKVRKLELRQSNPVCPFLHLSDSISVGQLGQDTLCNVHVLNSTILGEHLKASLSAKPIRTLGAEVVLHDGVCLEVVDSDRHLGLHLLEVGSKENVEQLFLHANLLLARLHVLGRNHELRLACCGCAYEEYRTRWNVRTGHAVEVCRWCTVVLRLAVGSLESDLLSVRLDYVQLQDTLTLCG